MSWADTVVDEIAEMFSLLDVPTYAGFSTFHRVARETAAERRARETADRKRAERLAYFRNWSTGLRSVPLTPVEVDGEIWLRPPPALERQRARSRAYQRARRAT